jgi:parallel beta-helix repeat protein
LLRDIAKCLELQNISVTVNSMNLAIIFLAALCGGPTGNSYFVAPSGSDTNACTAANPCREIRKPLTFVQPGDAIYVADGVYSGFTASAVSGNATNPITVKAQGSNAYVNATVDRSDNRDNIQLSFCNYVVIDGLNATNAPRAGMRIDECTHVTVRNGHFGSNTTWGIFTDFSDDLLIENNECHHSVQQHGIYHSNSGDRPTIRGNYCHDNNGIGIHMNGDATQGGDGLITGAIVENNIIVNNGTLGGAGINMDGVQNSIVRNNLLISNHASGIAMFQIDGAQGPKGDQIYNNTIDQAADARWALQITEAAGANVVRNNIFNQRNNSTLRGCINYGTNTDVADSDYNILTGNAYVSTNNAANRMTLTQWQAGGHELHSSSNDIANLVVAPLTDYHLKTNSPAIDAGQTLAAVTTDLENLGRPDGSGTDVGAYEFGAQLIAPPVFVSLMGTNVCVSVATLDGKLYELDFRDDLTAGIWLPLTNLTGSGDVLGILDVGGAVGSKRFYRVQISP